MVKKIKNHHFNKQEIYFGFLIFIFFMTISFFSPINGDDWGNYIIGTRGLRGWIGQAIGMYFDWEGRFASRLLINMLTYNKWLWNIFNASSMTILYVLTMRLVNPKKPVIISLILILGMLLIGNDIFTQTYLWIAGNLTYFTPLVLIFVYLYMIDYYIKKTTLDKWYIYVLLFVLNLIIPMFIENIGAILVSINMFISMYLFVKNKKINKLFLASLIISLISFLTMILSPGTALRVAYEASVFNQVSIFEKVMINIPNFIKYTFTENIFLLLIFPISFLYLSFSKIKNTYLRVILLIVNVIPYMTVILNFANSSLLSQSAIASSIKNFNFLYEMNAAMLIYWILYLSVFFVLIIMYFKNNPKVIFYFIIGIMSNGVMLMSPVWGARTSLFTVYMLIVVNLFIFSDMVSKIKNTKFFIFSGKGAIFVIMFIYIILYYNVNLQNDKRESDIKIQLDQNKQMIEIECIPDYALWGINSQADYHVKTFKQYYKIPDEKTISITPFKYKYMIFYK